MNYSLIKAAALIILSYFVLLSCNKNTKSDIIPKNEFIKILAELDVSNAIFTQKALIDRKLKDSTESYYNYVLKKHDISRHNFDNSLKYYSSNLENFLKIYDQVIDILNGKLKALNSNRTLLRIPQFVIDSVTQLQKIKRRGSNIGLEIWGLKRSWTLPKDGKTNPIKYKFKLSNRVRLVLSAKILVFPDDGTVDPRMTLLVYYQDGTHDGKYLRTIKKDGRFHKYLIDLKTNVSKKPVSAECFILDHGKGTSKKHSKVKNISLKKYFIAEKIYPAKRKYDLKMKGKNN